MNYRQKLDQLKGQYQSALETVEVKTVKIKKLKRKAKYLEESQQIIQVVAQRTQQELEYQVSELVSLAMESTFPNPYNLKLDFVPRRGKTEADITFHRKGVSESGVHPLTASGGGACDVASLALRFSVWSLSAQKSRPIFLLDEPFKNINDPSRELHESAAEMLREVCDKLGIQIIVITLMPELIEVADKTFRAKKTKKGVSKVKEV